MLTTTVELLLAQKFFLEIGDVEAFLLKFFEMGKLGLLLLRERVQSWVGWTFEA